MKEKSKCSIYFKYLCSKVIYDKVGIVGGLDTLKNWDINNPVFLNFNEKDKIFISSQIDLPMNEIIEYKYVFHHKNEKKWENLQNIQNRKIEIKLNVPQIILDKEGDPNSIIKPIPKTLKKRKKKKKKTQNNGEKEGNTNKEKDEEVKKMPINNDDIDDELKEKLEKLDYDSDDKEEINKDNKDQKQKVPPKYIDINPDDDIIMCTFNLPFEPIKEKDTFQLKLTNSPLYHMLYRVIEKEKNIKWFGSLIDAKNYTKEEMEEISKLLKEKNMYLLNIDSDIYDKTKILFSEILEPLCHYITLDENSMDTYVNFSEYWKEYKKYIFFSFNNL